MEFRVSSAEGFSHRSPYGGNPSSARLRAASKMLKITE